MIRMLVHEDGRTARRVGTHGDDWLTLSPNAVVSHMALENPMGPGWSEAVVLTRSDADAQRLANVLHAALVLDQAIRTSPGSHSPVINPDAVARAVLNRLTEDGDRDGD